MARQGSFGGLGGFGSFTLDPFGGSRGGLGRYNVGDAMATIDAMERYAISIGWQNGTVSDDDYLDSLREAVERSPEGSSDRISAENTLGDAIYTIGRNKLVRNVNNSATDEARIAAYRDLIDYDTKKLATMKVDNEQRRELVDRIAGAKADIRATRWSQIVRSYNENKTSNESMVRFAKSALAEAQGQPDQQTWSDRVFEFSERVKDDHLEQLRQDYDMDRVSGETVLAFVTQRLKEMAPGSPRYNDLTRWREDFAKAFHADEAASKYAAQYSAYQEGKISDDEWLHYLHTRVSDAPRGSDERKAAEHDLVMETFRVTEAHLTYNVAVNNAPVSTLINFYRSSLVGLDHGSARAQDLLRRIHDLRTQGIGAINLGGDTADPDHTGPGHTIGNTGPGPGNGSRSGNNPAIEAVIQSARSYLGTTYRLGAESRTAIDCSGLVYRAFTDAGYGSLIGNDRKRAEGYQSYGQQQGEFFTDRSQARRGDLVIYGNGKHIGIYLGNGKVLSAITTGVSITRANALGIPITGYVHPSYSGTSAPTLPRNTPRNAPKPAARRSGQPGGVAPQTTRTATETPQRVRQGEQVTTRSQAAPSTTPTDAPPSGNQRPPTALPGATTQMGRELLRQLGVGNPSDEQVRAAATWLYAENGSTVSNNNPFNLITGVGTGTGNWLPGQVAVDGDGYAVFDTWQHGIAAAAGEIRQSYPTIASAFRTNDPNKILTTIEKSEWRPGGYSNQLVPVYNSTGPSTIVVGGGQQIFDTPQSLAALATQAPSIAHLFDINPGDPASQAWFEKNLANLKAAYSSRDSNGMWWYETPNGNQVHLPFAPEMYFSALAAQADYQHIRGESSAEASTRETLRNTGSQYNLASWRDELDAIDAASSQAYADGNINLALQLKTQALAASAQLLGIDDPTTTDLDVRNYNPGASPFAFNDQELSDIQERLDTLKPRTDRNPQGDLLLGLFDVHADAPSGQAPLWRDENGRLHVHDEDVYFTEDGAGRIVIKTWQSNPDDFAQDDVIDPVTGETRTVPHYKTTMRAIGVGAEIAIRMPTTSGSLGISVLDHGGYRNPAEAEQNFLGISGNAFVGPHVRGLDIAGDSPLTINGLVADRSNPFYGLLPNGQAPAPKQTPANQPNDFTVNRAFASMPDVPMVRYYDHASKQWLQSYSIDGGKSWIIAPTSVDVALPTIVLAPEFKVNIRTVVDPKTGQSSSKFQVQANDGTWHDYTAADGPLNKWFHWYGTDDRDNAGPSQGTQGARYVIHRADIDGGFNGSLNRREVLTLTDADAYRRAVVTFESGKSGQAKVGAEHPWLAAEIRGVEGGFAGLQYMGQSQSPPQVAATAAAEQNDRFNQLAGGYAATGAFLPPISGNQVASNTRALASTTQLALNTPRNAPQPVGVTTAPVRPPIAADQPTVRPIEPPAAPAPRPTLPTNTPRNAPKPYVPPVPRTSYNTSRTPPVNPRPQPAPVPGSTPTIPGVSTRPRAPHEND